MARWTIIFVFISGLMASAQPELGWMDFHQLEDSLKKQPKRSMIYFYTDDCVYCKKMDKSAFAKAKTASLLKDWYIVKMDARSRDTIRFFGKEYVNRQAGSKRFPVHDVALLLASRKDRKFSTPAIIILDEKFRVLSRYFSYLSPEELQAALLK